ncbi:DUF1700 domain-containing protein [Massilia glaciei]|uniref:DUF1700 domain-containing protein n=1 Tax=Massilia glaciei TaxID=1524097 RepID=A0A2U2HG47_9BURK|nr:DUF1700 domain-containing protein [Massilia glaciei]PWF43679.1 DUF1700 domain-containing protein [Massilia glaciei]
MGKMEFLDALKRAMAGLAPELQAKTLAYYEQRFVDGEAAGRDEQDIAREFGDPKQIAMTLRANTHMKAFEQARNPANFVRMLFSALGLLIFNLFMLVPAIVYAALLTAMFAAALGLYVGGIAITASGLSGANELVLDGPMRHLVVNDGGEPVGDGSQTRITIDEMGIRVKTEKSAHSAHSEHGAAADEADAAANKRNTIINAERLANRGIHITTGMDSDSRAAQTALGLATLLGGIILLLLCLVVSRYTLIGIKRYVQMNISLIKGN